MTKRGYPIWSIQKLWPKIYVTVTTRLLWESRPHRYWRKAVKAVLVAYPDRVLVFPAGKVVEEFSALEATEEKIMYRRFTERLFGPTHVQCWRIRRLNVLAIHPNTASKHRCHIEIAGQRTNDLGAGNVHKFWFLLNSELGLASQQKFSGVATRRWIFTK